MDIQLTDFENTALTVMVGMIANLINTFDIDPILPITLVDENMKRAHIRNGISQAKFWWKVPNTEEVRLNDIDKTHFVWSNANNKLK